MAQSVDSIADLWNQQFFILQQKHTHLLQEHVNVLNQLSIALQSIANQSFDRQEVPFLFDAPIYSRSKFEY